MKKIDEKILDINKNIEKNIEKNQKDRGFLSQNILSQLRNFLEYIARKYYYESCDKDLSDVHEEQYQDIAPSLKFTKGQAKLSFLNRFHKMLQQSASHYTFSEDISERLMLKYYEYLLKIKKILMNDFKLQVLANIKKFPINLDKELHNYHKKIVDKLEQSPDSQMSIERYYIQKITPFFIGEEVYYEITFNEAHDYSSKFDRNIAFTKKEMISNYAVKLSIRKEIINIYETNMPILIIDDWETSIRPCEFDNLAKIFDKYTQVQANHNEYKKLMKFISETKKTILDIILLEDADYKNLRTNILSESRVKYIYPVLDECRKIVKNNQDGSNVLRYLLYNLRNKIIKDQTPFKKNKCQKLSDLILDYRCIPFDQMPFASSLKNHNPSIYNLIECIDVEEREHELLARKIQTNSEKYGQLYTHLDELKQFDKVNEIKDRYNEQLYSEHKKKRSIECIGSNYYIANYEDSAVDIINILKEKSKVGLANYKNFVKAWINETRHVIDCENKKTILLNMFDNSKVALIYGAAGTGKSTMVNHVSNFFADHKKLLIANTNPAVDNLKRKVNAPNCEYKTISKYLYGKEHTEYDLLIIDECSTVSNSNMLDILNKHNFKLLLLVGDIYQIESITFGNWFKLAKNFISNNTVFELLKPYRTTDACLLKLWDKVRYNNDDIKEYLVTNHFSSKLDEKIFEQNKSDEIILCLNYDGLYGINNINRFLQNNNPSQSIYWGIVPYKINDPVLFNESRRFSPILFNNLKGKIVGIQTYESEIIFDIEIEKVINEIDIGNLDLQLISSTDKNSTVRFSVYKNTSDNDNDGNDTVVPFQVAYAISIHKAQGLEFDSVKLIITNQVDELITHNIFYTAITRAKKHLKVYWTPETENKIIENIKINNIKKDESILKRRLK